METNDRIKRSEWLIVIISVVSVFIAGIALYATLKQMKASEKAYQAQAWQMLNTSMLEIDKLFVEKPEIRPYFYSGKPISKNDKNFLLVMSFADLHLDFFDSFDDPLVRELPGMEPNGKFWPLWEKYFIDTFSSSPALCQRYDDKKDWYGSALGSFAEKGRNGGTKKNPVENVASRPFHDPENAKGNREAITTMNNLLSGFLGAIIGAILTIGYLHFSERVKRRIDATIELIDYIDELYNHIMAMSFQPINQPGQVALLSPDEYRASVNRVIILLTSTKPQTRLDMLFRNKNIIDDFEQLRKAFKEALDSCHDKENFNNVLNNRIDPLYKKLHSRLISGTRLLNAMFS